MKRTYTKPALLKSGLSLQAVTAAAPLTGVKG